MTPPKISPDELEAEEYANHRYNDKFPDYIDVAKRAYRQALSGPTVRALEAECAALRKQIGEHVCQESVAGRVAYQELEAQAAAYRSTLELISNRCHQTTEGDRAYADRALHCSTAGADLLKELRALRKVKDLAIEYLNGGKPQYDLRDAIESAEKTGCKCAHRG